MNVYKKKKKQILIPTHNIVNYSLHRNMSKTNYCQGRYQSHKKNPSTIGWLPTPLGFCGDLVLKSAIKWIDGDGFVNIILDVNAKGRCRITSLNLNLDKNVYLKKFNVGLNQIGINKDTFDLEKANILKKPIKLNNNNFQLEIIMYLPNYREKTLCFRLMFNKKKKYERIILRKLPLIKDFLENIEFKTTVIRNNDFCRDIQGDFFKISDWNDIDSFLLSGDILAVYFVLNKKAVNVPLPKLFKLGIEKEIRIESFIGRRFNKFQTSGSISEIILVRKNKNELESRSRQNLFVSNEWLELGNVNQTFKCFQVETKIKKIKIMFRTFPINNQTIVFTIADHTNHDLFISKEIVVNNHQLFLEIINDLDIKVFNFQAKCLDSHCKVLIEDILILDNP